MRKPKKYKSDYMSELMDEELELLEDTLTALYANAAFEVNAKFAAFKNKFEPEYAEWLEMLENGEITQDEFNSLVQSKILRTELYENTVDSITEILVNTDVAAMALVRGELPLVLAQSYNFGQSLGFAAADEAGLSVGTFQVYNAHSVQAIIKNNPDLLPNVDLPADQKWNKNHINTAITQSIIQGEDMTETAKRLQRVTGMDESAAIRNARTAMTGAENLGRSESYNNIKSKGIPVHFVWSAVLDNRTRDSHLLLDGTYRDDETGLFGEGIIDNPLRYAGDPEGAPEEIYNCRCRCGTVFDNSLVDHSKDEELYEQFMKEKHPDDWAAMKTSANEIRRTEEKIKTKQYQDVLKEINKKGYYTP